MQARREKAADGCFCTHESNSYYPSLPLNPGHLIQIKRLEGQMKKAQNAAGGVPSIALLRDAKSSVRNPC
jgi:hypothetical protein